MHLHKPLHQYDMTFLYGRSSHADTSGAVFGLWSERPGRCRGGHGAAYILVCERREEDGPFDGVEHDRSEEHTSEHQSLEEISSAVLCLKKKNN